MAACSTSRSVAAAPGLSNCHDVAGPLRTAGRSGSNVTNGKIGGTSLRQMNVSYPFNPRDAVHRRKAFGSPANWRPKRLRRRPCEGNERTESMREKMIHFLLAVVSGLLVLLGATVMLLVGGSPSRAFAEANSVTFPPIEQFVHYTTVERGDSTEHMMASPATLAPSEGRIAGSGRQPSGSCRISQWVGLPLFRFPEGWGRRRRLAVSMVPS